MSSILKRLYDFQFNMFRSTVLKLHRQHHFLQVRKISSEMNLENIKNVRECKEIEIPVPWGHISGKWWGPRDKNPVIALHGWQDNAGTFDNLMPLLPLNLPVLCIDLPGHGFSAHLSKGQFYYIWWDSLIVVRRVVKWLGLSRVSLLGHSLGGGSGFLYAATYPEEVEKLVCIDIAYPQVERSDKLVAETGGCIDRFISYEEHTKPVCHSRQTMLDMVEDGYKMSRANCEVLMRRGMKPSPSDPDMFYFTRDPSIKVASMVSFSKELVLAYAKKIKCEYLNIRADPGLQFPMPELYGEVLDTIKQNAVVFEAHKVEGSHHIHLEDAPSIAGIVGSFLATERPGSIAQNHDNLVI